MTPYYIYHLQLEKQMDIYDHLKEHSRYYIQIWWRQIPLGFLYIEEDDKLDRNDLQLKIIRSIRSCVDFYLSTNDATDENYISAFLNNDQQSFVSIMNTIFSPYETKISQQVVDVSVIICTHNRSKDLFNCLNSLFEQQCLPQEVIVVDNAPLDESTKKVVEQFPGVIYLKEERKGLSYARNTGVKLATSSIIAFTDDDVKVHPLWLHRVWETFLIPEVKAMTGLVIPTALDTDSQQLFEKYWGFTKNYCDREFTYSFIERGLKRAPEVWSIGAGANMAFRRNIFESIGFFDERLGAGASGCSEDSELWFRVLINGHRIHYNPRAITCHTHRREMKSLRKQLFYYARGHMAAALIQELAIKDAGYKNRVYIGYPKFYLRRLIKGFPFYKNRNRTLINEILGWYAGIRFFKKYCNKQVNHYKGKHRVITESVNQSKAI